MYDAREVDLLTLYPTGANNGDLGIFRCYEKILQ